MGPGRPEPRNDLIRKLSEAPSEQERERWLRVLADSVSADDPASVERYAIGLAIVKRYTKALRFWRILVDHEPASIGFRLNMAACLLSAGRTDESAHQMEDCARRCREDDPLRPLVDRRLAEQTMARRRIDRESSLLELRADAYRELVAQGKAGLSDLKELCRVLGSLLQGPGSGVSPAEFIAVAERILAEAPTDIEAMELVAWARLLMGDQDRLADALRALERFAPDSGVLAAFRAEVTDPGLRQASDELKRRWDDIVERASHSEPGAEDELRRELRRFPENEQLRVGLLFAVYGRAADGRGDYEEARRLALELAADPKAGHHTHFHVAQFLWILGERDRSRQHFALALESSENENERENVRSAMRTVGADRAEGAHG